ncbi:hypothetical protein CUJ83_04820 [Methanocella sp. CWC-04]|uniref:DUF5320 domain-containing protein n=1 Tax=Methanooceanicella nereidis TaxID=2052831 RepID=A0AAP2RCW3_9EURY|nr:hypothetical protein [Methanocella sp. CWC-04]MCD1294320.1 hypothetical protein [Methanocella sp. CWC-04]
MVHHEHKHAPGSHPSGYVHHEAECPYCRSGGFKSKDEELSALEKFKQELGDQIKDIERRMDELKR